jgi:hypothetical protein
VWLPPRRSASRPPCGRRGATSRGRRAGSACRAARCAGASIATGCTCARRQKRPSPSTTTSRSATSVSTPL